MKNWTPVIIVVAIVAVIALAFGGTYNKLVAADENVKSSWSQVENVYQRRMDLIPNLVETVKGYAKHEENTLLEVTNARAKATQTTASPALANDPAALAKFEQAQGELGGALSRLLVVVEKYPDLKANQNFLELQNQLEGTENRITVERRRFNEAAQGFNTLRRTFPNSLVAGVAGFKEKAYFQADSGAEKVPAVKF